MNLISFLLAAIGPLAVRACIALGLGVLTFTGVDGVLQTLKTYVINAWGGMPADLAALAGLSGGGAALGMILGAMTARVSLWLAASATRWAILK